MGVFSYAAKAGIVPLELSIFVQVLFEKHPCAQIQNEEQFSLEALCFVFAAVQCEDPGMPVNGQRVLNNLKYGGVANFSCTPGFKMVGHSSMRCLASGRWLGRVPTCEGAYSSHLQVLG